MFFDTSVANEQGIVQRLHSRMEHPGLMHTLH